MTGLAGRTKSGCSASFEGNTTHLVAVAFKIEEEPGAKLPLNQSREWRSNTPFQVTFLLNGVLFVPSGKLKLVHGSDVPMHACKRNECASVSDYLSPGGGGLRS